MRRSGAFAVRLRIHGDELRLLAIEPQCGQLAAPYTPGVDGVNAKPREASERGPVPAHDAGFARADARHFEPRIQPGALRTRRPLRSEEHTSELQSLAYLVCR